MKQIPEKKEGKKKNEGEKKESGTLPQGINKSPRQSTLPLSLSLPCIIEVSKSYLILNDWSVDRHLSFLGLVGVIVRESNLWGGSGSTKLRGRGRVRLVSFSVLDSRAMCSPAFEMLLRLLLFLLLLFLLLFLRMKEGFGKQVGGSCIARSIAGNGGSTLVEVW